MKSNQKYAVLIIILMLCSNLNAQLQVTSVGNTRLNYNHWTGGLTTEISSFSGYSMPILRPYLNWYGGLGSANYKFAYAYVDHLYYQALTSLSDKGIKENIRNIENVKENFKKLRPVKFDLKESLFDSADNKIKPYLIRKGKNNIGLIAQEVQEIFPELVTKDESNGLLGINYIDLIPYLIAMINEQQSSIEQLQKEIDSNKVKASTKSALISTSVQEQTTSQISFLEQNSPNPFTDNTKISFYIDEAAKSAMIYIYDMSGHQIDNYQINERGQSSITIEGRRMKSGVYAYVLIVDSRLVDNKTMVLTNN